MLSKVVLTDAAGVCRTVAEDIVNLALQRVTDTGRFTIALAGGSTPRLAYQLMATAPLVRKMPWTQTRFYFGDERHVAHDHPDSNYRMAFESMLKTIPPGVENVFPIPTENEDPQLCAEFYEDLLRAQFQRRTDNLPGFDLILLGVGADGHTASLFPGTPAVNESQRWVTVCDPLSTNPSVKPAVQRITITTPVITHAANVFVLATGAEKAPVVAGILADEEPPQPPVARLVRKARGNVKLYLDRAAAG